MKKTVLIFVFIFLLMQTVGATVVDTCSPYFGDYLFVYNPTESSVEVTDIPASAQNQWMLQQSEYASEEPTAEPFHPVVPELPEQLEIVSSVSSSQNGVRMSSEEMTVGDVILVPLIENIRSYPYTYVSKRLKYLAASEYCNVFVEMDAQGNPMISMEDAARLSEEYDSVCEFMIPNFGDYISYIRWKKIGNYYTGKIEYVTNAEDKVSLYVYDIPDGFSGSGSYVAGYFWSADWYPTELNGSGICESIIHLDTYPSMGLTQDKFDVSKIYSTMVHETQHLISSTDWMLTANQKKANEAWWDEAFSMAAEHMYHGMPLVTRINGYNAATNSAPLRNGLVLNYLDYSQNNNHTASNYSTSYLFGQYLRTQTKGLSGGGNQIFKTILSQPYGDYQAILEGLSSIGYPYLPRNFFSLYANFRMATVLHKSSGPHGFRGESAFSSLVDNAYTGTDPITLKPGAGVLLMKPENFIPPENSSLAYVAFSDRGVFSYDLNPVSDGTLNVTHGTKPTAGIRLFAAGYNVSGQLLGITEIPIDAETENYPYTMPEGTVTKKFFLFAADGSLKPLSFALEQ